MGISTLGERYLVESKHSTSPKSPAKNHQRCTKSSNTKQWQPRRNFVMVSSIFQGHPVPRVQIPASHIVHLSFVGVRQSLKGEKATKTRQVHDTWWFLPRTRLEFRNRIQNMNYIWDKSSKGKQLWKINFRRLLERKYFKWQERRSTHMLINLKVEI